MPGGCQSCVSTLWAKPLRQPVDHRHHLVAVRHAQAPAGAKVVLDVDHQENVAFADVECAAHGLALSLCARLANFRG